MSLEALSNELLVNIIDFASRPSDTAESDAYHFSCAELTGLVRCNKHFHALTTPILYRTFNQRNKDKLQLFLLRVLYDEAIRRYVKDVAVSPYHFARIRHGEWPEYIMCGLSFLPIFS